MDKVIVIGGGGHAKVLISVMKKTDYEIVGYTDLQNMGEILGIQYLGDDGILQELIKKNARCKAVIGVGKINASGLRIALQTKFEKLGFDFPSIVSPHAVINEEVMLGSGSVVFDGVVMNSGAELGKACIVNTNSTVEHDCRIGDNVHIAPGATLSGGVKLGNNCLIGTGANVIQSVSICDNCLIGAGSTVVKDISTPGTYVGNPAKRIK